MGIAERYREYADAFEESYADDDWSRLEAYFTENAAYDTGQGPDAVARGRDALIARLHAGVDAFDRKMDERILDFDEPEVEGDRLCVGWRVTYRKAGAPDLVIAGRESAEFEGDRIRLLRDEFDADAQVALQSWMRDHGAKLGG